MQQKKYRLIWIPGLKRPNFNFPPIRFKIPTRIPPEFLYFTIFVSIFYVFAGGVYDIVEHPFARGSTADGNPILVWPDQDRQFLLEGIVAAMLMFIGAMGLFVLHKATADPHNPERATYFQLLAYVIIIVAFIALQSMFNHKR